MATTTIGTHDGSFHCDEALACYMLQLLPEFAAAPIVRSRDPAKLAACTVVVDVGGVYDPATHRYDHHQREFKGTMQSLANKRWTTKLSSAGLVYLHFGRQVIRQILGAAVSDETVEILYDKTYDGFIEEIDAIDNGVNQYDGEPRYRITSTISQRVGRLAPAWNEPNGDYDGQFRKAMQLAGSEFAQSVMDLHTRWLPARDIVVQALSQRFQIHPSGAILQLDSACPWKAHLYDLEDEHNKTAADSDKICIKYVLFTDQGGKWRVMCVSEGASSFNNRLSLPEPWCGLRDAELSKVSGIPGCVFVHASGFIGGNDTREGALEMAAQSLTFPRA